jgi:DNA-directed RNA polymerase subunit RPC12/RpoP
MTCPHCGSERLAIRQRKGLEAVISRFTNTRKYLCIACRREFRMIDRRKEPRNPEDGPKRKALQPPLN